MNNVNTVAGCSALCLLLKDNPVLSYLLITVILMTCATVMLHILISCWIANRKALKRRQRDERTTRASEER